ncbi:MAG: AAA family ATPase [Deltaproteobacteria bacterium]|nr:AAA family ATPase [Deltaproteobacteria bacterium]
MSPDYGEVEPLGETGLVVGRFLPLHRGHEYLIEFARASVQKLTVLVFVDEGDPIPGRTRVKWIGEQYPDVRVEHVTTPFGCLPTPPHDDARSWAQLAELVEPFGRHRYLFASELAFAAAALAIGADFVPVDPARATVPISGTAIRSNVMEHFRYVARPARPWFVRRVAVVGAERTGKTTLCAWLRERFGCLAVPAWTHTLVESGGALTPARVQLAARSQIAAEDALATQLPAEGTAGILLCDTELLTVQLWSEQRFGAAAPAWIAAQAARRTYDAYLVCVAETEEQEELQGRLLAALRGRNVVELAGPHEERCSRAADAIVELFAPAALCSARGANMA